VAKMMNYHLGDRLTPAEIYTGRWYHQEEHLVASVQQKSEQVKMFVNPIANGESL